MRPAIDSRFHRAFGHFQDSLNFAVIQSLQIAQDYRFAQFRRQGATIHAATGRSNFEASASLSGVRAGGMFVSRACGIASSIESVSRSRRVRR